MSVEKAKDFRGTTRKLIRYIGSYRIALLFVLIFAVCSTVFNIRGPKVMGQAVTEIYTGLTAKVAGTGGLDFGAIGRYVGIMLAL